MILTHSLIDWSGLNELTLSLTELTQCSEERWNIPQIGLYLCLSTSMWSVRFKCTGELDAILGLRCPGIWQFTGELDAILGIRCPGIWQFTGELDAILGLRCPGIWQCTGELDEILGLRCPVIWQFTGHLNSVYPQSMWSVRFKCTGELGAILGLHKHVNSSQKNFKCKSACVVFNLRIL